MTQHSESAAAGRVCPPRCSTRWGRRNVLWTDTLGPEDSCPPLRLDRATEASPGVLSAPEALDADNPRLASIAPAGGGRVLAAWFADGEKQYSSGGCVRVNQRPRLAKLSREQPTGIARLSPPRLRRLEPDTAAVLSGSPRRRRVIGIWQELRRQPPPTTDQRVAIRISDYTATQTTPPRS